MASCGPPRGLCSPLTVSVGWAPGPGCWVGLSLMRPFVHLRLRPVPPGRGERGLGESSLCFQFELQYGEGRLYLEEIDKGGEKDL